MAYVQATERVRMEWLRRVEAEYRSSAITQQLVLWLTQIAASPDLLKLGFRISADELRHAELSHRVYRAAKGQGFPALARESLALTRIANDPLEHDILRACVSVFCLGETVAVPLFKALRETCEVPSARRALDRVLRDEVRHRDFGWMLLGWLLDQPYAPQLREILESELSAHFSRLLETYAGHHVSADMSPAERSWGLMPAHLYAAVLRRAFTRDYLPRFAKLGIDAQLAWEQAESRHQGTLRDLAK